MRVRSVLFVPGSRPDRFEKALAAGADQVVVDLEDAVAPDGKDTAREAAIAAVSTLGGRFAVRLNSPRTAWGCADIAAFAASAAKPAFVMIPKCEHAVDVEIVASALGPTPPLMALVESAQGLRHAYDIAAGPRVAALVFGGGDYAADVGGPMEWETLFHARSVVVAAAAAAGVPAVDVPHIDVKDEDGLRATTARVRALGFSGRLCIHPVQAPVVNAVFAPGPDDIAHAQRVIAALKDAGGGAALLDGKLLEEPIIRAARRTLQAAAEGETA